MMRRFTLLLFGIWLGATSLLAHADEPQANEGHIGSSISRAKGSDFVTVDYVAVGSPASLAGIKQGDIIMSINGISTKGLSLKDARESMRGEIGGVIKLTVYRENAEEEVSVTRQSLLKTYSVAATGGDFKAEFYLGDFYELGPSSSRNLALAAEWYRKAADQDYAPAQVELAYMLRFGYGIPKDTSAAIALYLKATGQGDVIAERELAYCYLNGEGVTQSDRNAFAWFYSAAQSDDPAAEENLGFLYGKGRGVARSDREAFDWHYRAAQLNDPYGAWGLAYMYQNGLGVPRNTEEALKWYQKAQIGLPYNKELDGQIASLKATSEHPAQGWKQPFDLIICVILLISFGSGNLRLKTENKEIRSAIRLGSFLIFASICSSMVPDFLATPYRVHWIISMTTNLILGIGVGIFACIKLFQRPGEESPFSVKPSKWSLKGRS